MSIDRARHGLTLIELVVSLALLGMLTSVMVTWTVSAAERRTSVESANRWAPATTAAIDTIALDLLRQDLPAEDEAVMVADNGRRLIIRTRDQGSKCAVYLYDDRSASLMRILPDDPRLAERVTASDPGARTLVGQVRSWRAELELIDPEDPEGPKRLTVTLEAMDGSQLQRLLKVEGAP